MRLGFRLTQEQTQKLVMTPELRQAIAILQLSALELSHYIEQELLENPVLEIKENDVDDTPTEGEKPTEKDEPFDMDWQEYFQDKSDLGLQPLNKNEENRFENFYAQAPNLHEHLLFQLALLKLDKTEQKIGKFLIGNIDEKGYLQCSMEEVAARYGVDSNVVEKILNLIHGFDPSGVGARNLAECLLIQMQQAGLSNPLLEEIIKNHLATLAESGVHKVSQVVHAPVQEVQMAADQLKTLDPKPGRKFGNPNDIRYIVPDIVVERVNGEYIILVNDTMVPRLNINHSYREILNGNHDTKTREFVEGKLNSASWLIKSIEQRRVTLYKVAQAIIEFQKEFFDHGIKYLKPLNLKQIASHIGVHESTISRATSNKYIQTPQGVFELKYFFASGVDNTEGTTTSSTSIKKTIKELIQEEDVKKPLSDQKLAEILQQKGINISRRTVAKYRDDMGIYTASRRKRY